MPRDVGMRDVHYEDDVTAMDLPDSEFAPKDGDKEVLLPDEVFSAGTVVTSDDDVPILDLPQWQDPASPTPGSDLCNTIIWGV